MKIDDKIKKDISGLEHVASSNKVIDQKLDELIYLLSNSSIDSEKARDFQLRFNQAMANSLTPDDRITAFKNLDDRSASSREELLDEFTVLLSSHDLNSKIVRKYLKGERLGKAVLMMISIILITLGFAMIIMPAPPYFEMFTIFYFNQEDGVTLMDLISLLIILSGVYLLVRSIMNKPELKG